MLCHAVPLLGPRGLPRRDLGGALPAAAGELVEVVAGVDGGVERGPDVVAPAPHHDDHVVDDDVLPAIPETTMTLGMSSRTPSTTDAIWR